MSQTPSDQAVGRDNPGRRFWMFALVGPVAGSTTCMLIGSTNVFRTLWSSQSLDLGAWVMSTLASCLFVAPFSYVVGLGPALLLGCATCAYPRRLPLGWRIVFSALLGSALSTGAMVIAKGMDLAVSDLLLAGAGAGAFCEWRVSRARRAMASPGV